MAELAHNRLLGALPASVATALLPDLTEIDLPLATSIYDVEGTAAAVYFPTTAIVSVVTDMQAGGTIEAGLVGNDGVTGTWIALDPSRGGPRRAMVQLAGAAFEMSAATFLRHLEEQVALRRVVLAFALDEQFFAEQSVGCNRFHELPRRTARWLLALRDRTTLEELDLTHEFLAQMLGVHRPSVTVALGTLEGAGLLMRSRRGRIRILDHAGLEAAACECYARVRDFVTRRALE